MNRPSTYHPPTFRDRNDAGRQLASRLRPVIQATAPETLVAIGLARGGVIVAAEVARDFRARLEALVVRKLGAPGQPELAIGAITAGTSRVMNLPLIRSLGIPTEDVEQISARARQAALELAAALDAPPNLPDLAGKTAIIVDDGLATGATMRIALDAIQHQGPRRIVVAVPVAPSGMIDPLGQIADAVVTVVATEQLQTVGNWYARFDDVPTETVRQVLQRARQQNAVE